jgi:hypothetical protein
VAAVRLGASRCVRRPIGAVAGVESDRVARLVRPACGSRRTLPRRASLRPWADGLVRRLAWFKEGTGCDCRGCSSAQRLDCGVVEFAERRVLGLLAVLCGRTPFREVDEYPRHHKLGSEVERVAQRRAGQRGPTAPPAAASLPKVARETVLASLIVPRIPLSASGDASLFRSLRTSSRCRDIRDRRNHQT